jgi:hypothetical protein
MRRFFLVFRSRVDRVDGEVCALVLPSIPAPTIADDAAIKKSLLLMEVSSPLCVFASGERHRFERLMEGLNHSSISRPLAFRT